MKIAFIGLRGVPAQYSGIERSVEEIGSRLVDKGHDVTVYCMAGNYPEKRDFYRGMRLKYIPTIRRKNFEMICYAFLSTVASISESFDITHFHALGPSPMSLLPRILNRKTLVTVHALDWKNRKWGGIARTYLRCGEWASRRIPHQTIVVSKTLKRRYESKCARRVAYIPNGTNGVAEFFPLAEAGKRFSLEKDQYLLFVGRLMEDKNVHLLIEAFKRLKTDIKLVIVGGSADGYIDDLKRLAGNDRRIVFTGPIYSRLLYQIYCNAYLFVLPSALEGLPVVLLEALSHGTPVLSSDIPENLETLDDDGIPRGFTFKTGEVESLRCVLEDLIEDADKVHRMREPGRRFIARKYHWDRIADQTLEVYENLLRDWEPIGERPSLVAQP